jgi:hypothetical protein
MIRVVLRSTIVVALALLASAGLAEAQSTCGGLTPDRWVAPVDQGTGSGNSEANAMDLPTALATYTSGQILCAVPYSVAGAYVGALRDGGRSNLPIFAAGTSGSSGDPSIIVCKWQAVELMSPRTDPARCELQYSGARRGGDLALGGLTNPVFGTGSGTTSYVEWWGWYVDEANAPAAPSGGVFHAGPGHHNALRNSVIEWTTSYAWAISDNFVGVFAVNTDDFTLVNCKFIGRNSHPTAAGHNNAAVTLYNAKRILIQNNTFDGVNAGVFVKGSNSDGGEREPFNDGTIKLNLFKDCANVAVEAGETNASRGFDVTQNIMARCVFGVGIDQPGPNPGHDFRVWNNTIVNPAPNGGGSACIGVVNGSGFTNFSYWNNICAFTSSSSVHHIALGSSTAAAVFTLIDWNVYYEAGGTVTFEQNGTIYTRLTGSPSWQALKGNTVDTHSIIANPAFQAGADNYKLQAGSPALTAGRVGGTSGGAAVPAGAYITGHEVIGASAAGTAGVELRIRGF